jgi:hypothetical protein
VRLSLERPLTLKYVDRVVFDSLIKAGAAERAAQISAKEKFLDQL